MTNQIYQIAAEEHLPNKYPKTTIYKGTLTELIKKFSLHLEIGRMQFKSVSKNPRTIKALVSNLNRADKAVNRSRLVSVKFSEVK